MSRILAYLAILALALVLAGEEHIRRAARRPVREGCLSCHAEVEDPDPSHRLAAFGCTACHLGNGFAFEEARAHQGMVRNPGDLEYAALTCGRQDCHPEVVARVKGSVMASNRGILRRLNALWSVPGPADVPSLLAHAGPRGLAADYFAKLCAGCHLWKRKDAGEQEYAQRGGGCSACHVVRAAERRDPGLRSFAHARLSTRIPLENCVRCHNRSARIGLTYQGRREDDGYGTPHEQGGPSRRRLSGGRFFQSIPADVHFAAGMVCIDCHTAGEAMGHGDAPESLEGQLDVACRDCHQPSFFRPGDLDGEARRLAELNRKTPPLGREAVARTGRRGDWFYALRLAPQLRADPGRGLAVLYRKLDGEPLALPFDRSARPHHALPGHARLTCPACHSRVMPQCYGCHVTLRRGGRQMDLLAGRETSGRWEEARSFVRLEQPALAVTRDDRVAPFSPCQVFVSVFGPDGAYLAAESAASAGMTPFDPHGTQKAARACLDCHLEPKTLGLGQGRLRPGPEPGFRATYDSASSNFGISPPPEGFVAPDGTPLQAFSGRGGRPFTGPELRAILAVAPCLPCHADYADPVHADFSASLRRVQTGAAAGCPLAAPRGAQAAPGREGASVQRDKLSWDTVSHGAPPIGPGAGALPGR